jgi:hypothetical protein
MSIRKGILKTLLFLGVLSSNSTLAENSCPDLPIDGAMDAFFFKDNIVYVDANDGNIYNYNTSTNDVNQITFNNHNKFNPCRSDKYVVWENYAQKDSDIYIYDFRTKKTRPICDSNLPEVEPIINEKNLIWTVYEGSPKKMSKEIPSPANLNGDIYVDFTDFSIFAESWMKSGENLQGDINESGKVDLEDLIIFSDDWLN